MAANKTVQTKASVETYLKAIKDEERKKDCEEISKIMEKISKEKPKMWGKSIVGFGSYHYKYASGREGDWMKIGFSSRKNAISLYLTCNLEKLKPLLKKLGKHKTGVGCLYIKRLADIDVKALKEIIIHSNQRKQKKI